MKTLALSVLLMFATIFTGNHQDKITIYLIGDSTMADKKPLEGNPERGWGMMLQQYFDSSVVISNHAQNGRSSRSFIAEGRWQKIVDTLKPGDYVVIQFGHNDNKPDSKDRYASPADYKINLLKFITEARAKGANPILCTPIVRRKFDESGNLIDTHGDYPGVVRQLADSLKLPLIDLQRKSEKLIADAGVEGSKKFYIFVKPGEYSRFPDGKEDNTHFCEYGANIMAQIAVERINELNIDLAKHIK